MTSERIEALKKRRQQEMKRVQRNNQKPYAWILFLIILGTGTVLFLRESSYMWVFPVGIFLGFTLERSRFCFAASIRNPLTIGTTKLLQAVILALMISTIGFFVLQIQSIDTSSFQLNEVPGNLRPVGWHTVIGGILFGIGMVIAGGCASGTLMRIGEGFTLQIIVLIAFIGGSVLAGIFHYSFWYSTLIEDAEIIYLPDIFGFIPALLLQLAVLGILYMGARNFSKKKEASDL
ncbi:YeeE/YedE thiosulfate transporter family protein [Isachenkonia alkalipeptolytica]|uniref:Transporter n=1 Tax=Isachenkonia alkalipeptolytica TaxID=2565777 RepID=A0AA43XK23_9CLOT|nr:YeeE/YedE thiosulfate transporter family protein [Isachenkonia alkalipeptolytica]NBG87335.1 transporter [Isachenkonia alkalipeptolytica]